MASTRAVGLAYELLSVKVLRQNGFIIEHCGRAGDKGVDFKGHWVMPAPNQHYRQVRIIGQCKNHRKKSSPNHIREIEGTLLRLMKNDSSNEATIGMLVTSAGFTQGTAIYCQLSPVPLILCHLKVTHDDTHVIVDNPSSTTTTATGYISKVVVSRAMKKICDISDTISYKLSDNGLHQIKFIC